MKLHTFKTVTKAELIEALEELNDNDLVAFSSDYGDISHTQQVHRIRGRIEEVELCESAYSDSGFAIADSDDEESDCDGHESTDGPIGETIWCDGKCKKSIKQSVYILK
jgi:hypothetical protein